MDELVKHAVLTEHDGGPCPDCGSIPQREGATWVCPKCGTRPFEVSHGQKEGSPAAGEEDPS